MVLLTGSLSTGSASCAEGSKTHEEYGPLVSLLQARRFRLITMELDSPIDYVEILSKLKARVNQVHKELSGKSCRIFVLPDPGTPQMQTASTRRPCSFPP